MQFPKGLFILTLHCVVVPIYWLICAASHRSIMAYEVKMNLTTMGHRNAVVSQFLCRKVVAWTELEGVTEMKRLMQPVFKKWWLYLILMFLNCYKIYAICRHVNAIIKETKMLFDATCCFAIYITQVPNFSSSIIFPCLE